MDMLFRSHQPTPSTGAKFTAALAGRESHEPLIWMVEDVHSATDGLPHALLVNTADPSLRKTVAVNALLDPALYRAVLG
jgi:hypothetical protein